MNIFGQPFDSWVRYQINKRQEILGKSTNISSQDLQYYHTKTPWIRLASTVDVNYGGASKDPQSALYKLKDKLGLPIEGGPDLARKAMLFGGTLNTSAKETTGAEGYEYEVGVDKYQGLSKGILDAVNNNIFSTAYGWGGTSERGFVPMPGIISAQTQYYNNGTFAESNIVIKCYSRTQMAIINALYMHPGYNLLLEFGWSTYIDNEGNLQRFDNFYTDPLSFVLNPEGDNVTHFDVNKKILAERKARHGNYEAVFGQITNFNWTFNKDGSYNCNTVITSPGSIIESLKVNIALPSKEGGDDGGSGALNALGPVTKAEIPTDAQVEDNPVITDAAATQINKSLYNLYQQCTSKGGNDEDKVWTFTFHNYADPYNNFENKSLKISKGGISLAGTTSDMEIQSPQVYMSFGALLALIQCRLLLYNKKGEKNIPLFYFDWDFDNLEDDKNYMCRIPGQMSSDPTVCLIAYDKPNIGDENDSWFSGFSYPTNTINDHLQKGLPFMDSNLYLGKMAGIYLNFTYIAECLKTAERSDDKSISVLSFINQLLSGVEEALGNINDFVVRVDSDENTIKIYDQSPQRLEKIPIAGKDDTYARFNVFGVKPDTEGSFVTDIQMKGEIGQNFMAQLAISAAQNGNQVSSDATSFENYNKGLIDRVMPKRANYTPDTDSGEEETPTAIKFWRDNITVNLEEEETSYNLFDEIYAGRHFNAAYIDQYKALFSQFLSLCMGELVQQKQLPFSQFLPFDLSIEMEGLSGMKMWEKFLIDDRILPPSYDEDSVDLQISGINHTITSNSWKTSLNTQASPKSELDAIKRPSLLNSSVTYQAATDGSGNIPAPPPAKPPADEKTRIVLRRLADDGDSTYGIMTVFDNSGNVLYALATIELPWKGNQNKISCIPPNDTYRVKSHVSGKHGKCFHLIGNGQGGYKYDRLYGNGYIRSEVLIHKSPIAPGWLQGCIGPGFKFNPNQKMKDQFGGSNENPLGTGDKYRDTSLAQSIQATNKLVGTLYNEGSFLMQIKNLNDVGEGQLPKTLSDPSVQAYVNGSELYKKLF